MTTNSQQFTQAATIVKKLKTEPNNDELLKLYGLYKQATIGDINIEKPGMFNFKGAKKWEAWNNFKGKSTYDSEVEYIQTVNTLIKKYGVNQ